MNTLTTHVLDTVSGVGAAGMNVSLHCLTPEFRFVDRLALDQTGRGVFESELDPGVYELRFEVEAYFKGLGQPTDEPAFLGIVPVRFGVTESGGHYHIPLIVSLFGYSTYRGG